MIHSLKTWLENSPPFVTNSIVLFAVVLLTVAVRYNLLFLAGRWLKHRKYVSQDFSARKFSRFSLMLLLFGIFSDLALEFIDVSNKTETILRRWIQVETALAATWFLIRVASLVETVLYRNFDIHVSDNFRQRRARTQIQFVFKIIVILICIVGGSIALMSFPEARQLGTSLLASAGIVSVVLGFAAQKSLGNFLAGFQIAFTQPFRIDDVVIVENEWGRVEEISLTYVVVKLWDLRRLILPITYFTEKPFQNWTRTTAEILGYSYIYVDYRVPVDEVRKELKRIVSQSPLWNGQVCGLQVTDMSEKTMQLRCLISANDASAAFDLRCEIREKILTFLQKNFPDSLPRLRAELVDNSGKKESTSGVVRAPDQLASPTE